MREEVNEAIFSIDDNNSPGLDRFGSSFFKTVWSIIGDDMTRTVLDFFKYGKMLLKSMLLLLL